MPKRKKPSTEAQDDALARIEATLAAQSNTLTASGRLVATFFRDNLALIPFETGASISKKLGVSEMTIIRCIQSLGYSNLREFKDALRSPAPDAAHTANAMMELFRVHEHDQSELQSSLKLQLEAVIKAYELTATERWRRIVELLVTRRNVFIVGFLATKGVAWDFASRMMTTRSGIRYVDGSDGVFVEVLEANPAESCLVIIDTVHRTRDGPALAQRAQRQRFPIAIIANNFNNWGYEYTDLILQGFTNVNTFWDSTASLSVITNLLVDSAAARLGKKAEEHYSFIQDVGRYFGAYDGGPRASVSVSRGRTRKRQ